jgi:GAF domain-containing protein
MADQLANAIKNAELFSQTQEALAEAEALYQMAQALSAARDETTVFEVAIANMAKTEVDAAAIYIYHTETGDEGVTRFVEQTAIWNRSADAIIPQMHYQPVAGFELESLVPDQEALLVDDLDYDANSSNSLRKSLQELQIGSLLIVPLAAHQYRLGFLLVAYKQNGRTFSKNQIRYFTTVAQQMVVTLENLRLLDESQKRARREQIIREITAKIRNATDVNDILKVTVSEVGKLVSTTRGRIVLGMPENGNETDKTGNDSLRAEESQNRIEG